MLFDDVSDINIYSKILRFHLSVDLIYGNSLLNHLSSRRDVFKPVPEDSSLRCW